jgi:hypothetical protein
MASIAHQVHRCLEQVTLNEDEIERLKTELGGRSVKQSLRPGGDPTKALPQIIGKSTHNTYFRTARTFFEQAKELTGEKQVGRLMTREIILNTFDYQLAPVVGVGFGAGVTRGRGTFFIGLAISNSMPAQVKKADRLT